MKRKVLAAVVALSLPQVLWAAPMLTEEPETLGKSTFQVGFSLSQRTDNFNSPRVTHKTINFPIEGRVGMGSKWDIGIRATYIEQKLKFGTADYKGSRTGLIAPLLKISPWSRLGFLLVWEVDSSEEGEQNLPVARGDNYELTSMLRLAEAWPTTLNVGYVVRGNYKAKFGVAAGPAYKVEPGDILQSKLAVEVPLGWHIHLLSELAYYNVGPQKIKDQSVPDSAGDALDGLLGFVWEYKGWNIGLAAAYGLLDESHTSFDYERGAGDGLYKLTLQYKLKAKKPGA